jgi:hypothetical protein|uniref:Tail protein n=1 Tax=Siphoviridae sp. ctazQ13 TaxID=2823587 RepID=A0A8S5LAY0_9CAUD|nr:MAG TPA: tail protein [Siphoviridae sp. ctazQ13]
MADLLINGKDALIEWGVRMGDNFLDVLYGYYPMKDYTTNNDRTQDGVQYVGIPKVNERNITLNFTMEGNSASDFTAKNKAFVEVMRGGDVVIQVPEDSPAVYHLKYTGKSCTFARNVERTFAKIGLAFIEPNPTNRT